MKTFIASLITFLVIISSVLTYIFFLNFTAHEFYRQIDKIIIDAEKEDWNSIKDSFNDLDRTWNSNKIWLESFINHSKTGQINELIAEINSHMKFEDKNQIILRANRLKLVFMNICDDELPTIENII